MLLLIHNDLIGIDAVPTYAFPSATFSLRSSRAISVTVKEVAKNYAVIRMQGTLP